MTPAHPISDSEPGAEEQARETVQVVPENWELNNTEAELATVEEQARELYVALANAIVHECTDQEAQALIATALRQSAASARENAAAWHQTVETILTIVGLSPPLDYTDIPAAVRARFDERAASAREKGREDGLREAEGIARRYSIAGAPIADAIAALRGSQQPPHPDPAE